MEPTMSERMTAGRRPVLSSLWIFVLLNILFRDIHEFLRPGAIEEYMALEVSDATLLASGMGLTLFISMIVLALVLPYRLNRWANLLVPALAAGGMLTSAPRDVDDVWFLAVQVAGLLVIVWLAWTWRTEDTDDLVATSEVSSSTQRARRRQTT